MRREHLANALLGARVVVGIVINLGFEFFVVPTQIFTRYATALGIGTDDSAFFVSLSQNFRSAIDARGAFVITGVDQVFIA